MEQKFYNPKTCHTCGNLYEGYIGGYVLDGCLMCPRCFKHYDFKGGPYFIEHVPAAVDGYDVKVFTFDDEKQLREKLTDRVPKGSQLVQTDENTIMYRCTTEKFWWVLGFTYNFDLSRTSIPVWDKT